MNEKEKREFVKMGKEVMMEYRGVLQKRIEAANYINIDEQGEGILEIIFDRFFEKFDLVFKDKAQVKWQE